MEDHVATPPTTGFATPTGAPCPRTVAVDGGVTATADCHGCGFCILLFEAAFGAPPASPVGDGRPRE